MSNGHTATHVAFSSPAAGVPPLQVHQGFYNGVSRHLPAVRELIKVRIPTLDSDTDDVCIVSDWRADARSSLYPRRT